LALSSVAMSQHATLRSERHRREEMRALVAALTPRERQVFGLVVRGKFNKQIAHELRTTERTIKAHRQQGMKKMKVHSLAELVTLAERLGLLG
jgi:FixJ family two-component response regulator